MLPFHLEEEETPHVKFQTLLLVQPSKPRIKIFRCGGKKDIYQKWRKIEWEKGVEGYIDRRNKCEKNPFNYNFLFFVYTGYEV